jgi:hypothetical protein
VALPCAHARQLVDDLDVHAPARQERAVPVENPRHDVEQREALHRLGSGCRLTEQHQIGHQQVHAHGGVLDLPQAVDEPQGQLQPLVPFEQGPDFALDVPERAAQVVRGRESELLEPLLLSFQSLDEAAILFFELQRLHDQDLTGERSRPEHCVYLATADAVEDLLARACLLAAVCGFAVAALRQSSTAAALAHASCTVFKNSSKLSSAASPALSTYVIRSPWRALDHRVSLRGGRAAIDGAFIAASIPSSSASSSGSPSVPKMRATGGGGP